MSSTRSAIVDSGTSLITGPKDEVRELGVGARSYLVGSESRTAGVLIGKEAPVSGEFGAQMAQTL
jgi:hypothetical protein